MDHKIDPEGGAIPPAARGGHREGAGGPTPGTHICGCWKEQSHRRPGGGHRWARGGQTDPRGSDLRIWKGKIAAVNNTQKLKADRPNPRVEVSGLKPSDDLAFAPYFRGLSAPFKRFWEVAGSIDVNESGQKVRKSAP